MNASSKIHAEREILQEIQRLNGPEMHRFVCPSCRGGSAGEKSLTIRRTGTGYSYICWRGTCGLGTGNINDPGIRKARTERAGVRRFVPKSFDGWSYNIDAAAWYSWPISKSGRTLSDYVSLEECSGQGWKMAAFGASDSPGWLHMPIYNYRGTAIADQLRGFYATSAPPHESEEVGGEILTFKFIDEPVLYFPHRETGVPYNAQRIVVVEDPISAVVVNNIAPCCALLSNNLTEGQVKILQLLAPKEVVMFLDGDPAGHHGARKAMKRYGLLFQEGVRNIHLTDKDPKDLSMSELEDRIMLPF